MQNTFTVNYQSTVASGIGIGLSTLALGAYISSFTKRFLPKVWDKSFGKLTSIGQKWYDSVKTYFKKAPAVV